MDNKPQPFQSTDEIEALVRRFEACALRADEFKHREHLTVVLWYLSKFDDAEAAARMRVSLYRFLDHHGVDRQKYHETITLFWIKKVRALLNQGGQRRSLAEMANTVNEACGDAKLMFTYYSQELIASAKARAEWVEPDLQLLDF
jgi:hypothetical protein